MTHSNIRYYSAFVVAKSLMPVVAVALMGFLLVLISAQFETSTRSQLHLRVLNDSKAIASDIERIFIERFESNTALVQFLAQQPTTNAYIERLATGIEADAAKRDLQQSFLAFIRNNPSFYQLRVLSTLPETFGMELLRVEHTLRDFVIVEDDQLQNKLNRDYFEPSSRLESGQTYVSNLSLNRERGKVERPLRPTVRFSTPLFYEGERMGFVIANIDMSAFLNEVSLLRNDGQFLMLKNEQGFFTYHYDAALQYGADLNERSRLELRYKQIPLIGDEFLLLEENFGEKRTMLSYSSVFNTVSEKNLTLFLLTDYALIIRQLNERRQTFYLSLVSIIAAFLFILFFIFRTLRKSQALKDVENLSRIKSTFISSVSHEMRTPLNGIVGALTLLSEKTRDKQSRKFISIAQTSSAILTSLINDVLDLSKIEADKLELIPVKFNPKLVVRELLTALSVTPSAKNMRIQLDCSDMHFASVTSDTQRLTQILNNLLSNAIKFTQNGVVKVSVRSHIDDINRGSLTFVVQDTGRGISKADQKKLFHNFAKVGEQRNSNPTGTGLGLVISKKLCEMMGGEIKLESTIGVGTTVTFTICVEDYVKGGESLPANISTVEFEEFSADTALEEDQEQEAEVEDVESSYPEVQGKCVIVVDDNEINTEIAKSLLAPLKLHIFKAQDGKEALNVLRRIAKMGQRCDLILMDCIMPIMDGFEATKEIRKGAAGSMFETVPIIAMTANAMKGDRQKCEQAGMNDYITKPLNKSILTELVVQYLTYGSIENHHVG